MESNFSVISHMRRNKAKGFIVDLEFSSKGNIYQEVLDTLIANKHDPHIGDLVTDLKKYYIFTHDDLLEIKLFRDHMIFPKYFTPLKYSCEHWSSMIPYPMGFSIDESSDILQRSKLCSVIPLKYFGKSHEFFVSEDLIEIRNIIKMTNDIELINKYEKLDDEDLIEDFLTYDSLDVCNHLTSIAYFYDSENLGILVSEVNLNEIKKTNLILLRREGYYQVVNLT